MNQLPTPKMNVRLDFDEVKVPIQKIAQQMRDAGISLHLAAPTSIWISAPTVDDLDCVRDHEGIYKAWLNMNVSVFRPTEDQIEQSWIHEKLLKLDFSLHCIRSGINVYLKDNGLHAGHSLCTACEVFRDREPEVFINLSKYYRDLQDYMDRPHSREHRLIIWDVIPVDGYRGDLPKRKKEGEAFLDNLLDLGVIPDGKLRSFDGTKRILDSLLPVRLA